VGTLVFVVVDLLGGVGGRVRCVVLFVWVGVGGHRWVWSGGGGVRLLFLVLFHVPL